MNLSFERVLRFVAVAEHLSFTKAASLLGIDQPWLSRQVMQLEDQLGFMLFDRGGSRIALTPEGLEFLRSAQQFSEAASQVRQKAEEMSRRMQSALRIGVSYSTFLIEGRGRLVGGYTAIRPNVSLDFSAFEWSQDVVQKLHEGAVDFGIVIGPITDPDIDVCVLQRIDASLAIPREDPLATAPCVTLADLAGRRVAIGLKDTTGQRYAMTYGWIEDVGASAVPVLECRRFIFDVAERDRLFVICYADGEGMPPSFVRRSIKGPRPIFDLSLIRYKRTMSPAGERLWRLGQELAAGEAVAA